MADRTDRLVTVFGGGGFIGRYVAQALLRSGVRVRVAQRDPRRAWFLQPLAAVGQIHFAATDIRDQASTARAVEGADAVINLVGVLKGDFQALHVDGAAQVARAAAAEGAQSLVHVSAIGADPDSPSAYGRSKGLGEQAVQDAFASATLIRPSVVFGREDDFVNRFARVARLLPVIPVLRGAWKCQPVHAPDLGRAIAAAALEPGRYGGQTHALGGPQVISMGDLNHWIAEATGRAAKPVVELPDAIGRAIARAAGWVPGTPITWDQWLMLQQDNVVDGGRTGFEPFGLRPTPLGAVAESWMVVYRRLGRFAQSPY